MEDDVVIKQRLLTRTTTTRGEPPLKKLIKKFIAFATEIEKEGNNFNDCEKLYKSFLQELATFELPLLKTKAVIEANRREQESFKNLHVELNNQIAQVGTPSSLFSQSVENRIFEPVLWIQSMFCAVLLFFNSSMGVMSKGSGG